VKPLTMDAIFQFHSYEGDLFITIVVRIDGFTSELLTTTNSYQQ